MQITGGNGTATLGARWGGYSGGVPTTGYNVDLTSSGNVKLFRINDWTLLGSYAIPGFQTTQWVTITLRANGAALNVDVNGITRITASDSTFTSGEVGVWSYNASSAGQHRFDDFSIQP
jgi:hypothetical protein